MWIFVSVYPRRRECVWHNVETVSVSKHDKSSQQRVTPTAPCSVILLVRPSHAHVRKISPSLKPQAWTLKQHSVDANSTRPTLHSVISCPESKHIHDCRKTVNSCRIWRQFSGWTNKDSVCRVESKQTRNVCGHACMHKHAWWSCRKINAASASIAALACSSSPAANKHMIAARLWIAVESDGSSLVEQIKIAWAWA